MLHMNVAYVRSSELVVVRRERNGMQHSTGSTTLDAKLSPLLRRHHPAALGPLTHAAMC